ncbi:MAG: helix-turn-helix domain-containing protein [Lachnospiraceae bacterium]
MFHSNLVQLRKLNHMSQEELADKIGISRQTLSKWETGESLPDIEKCKLLAELFGVTLDDLVKYESSAYFGLGVPPKGKHVFGLVTVGEKGQIVIPAKARKVFDIKAGDQLIVLGDEEHGIAIVKGEDLFSG